MAFALSAPLDEPGPVRRGPATSALARLTVTAFRSYERARLDIDPACHVVLTGANGAGKTNLLEAVSLLAPGRGLRGAKLAELDRIGGGPFGVAATVAGPDGSVEVATGRAPEPGRERRIVRIEGEAASQADLAGVIGLLWLTPAMDLLFQEGAAERRRFLDRLVLAGDPDHAARSARYTYALRERARLLRAGRRDPTWLGALEGRMAAAGTAIAAARCQTVAGLQRELARDPGPFLRPTLELDGEVEQWLQISAALEVEERLAAALAESRERDAEAGTTAVGPHRGDLLVAEQATGCPAARASTGQQKALLISIVLAEARRRAHEGGRLPLLLLDEIAAHLDPTRREQLFDELGRVGARAWLTGTEAAPFAALRGAARFVTVADSTLTPHD